LENLISIIIPAFNAEKDLNFCFDSLLKQTYVFFEIIIIDDGSTDKTYEIATKLQMKDKRIIVLQQNNRGASAARNLGLMYAKGDWITFCDSDDYVSKYWLQNFVDNSESVDLVSSGYILSNFVYDTSNSVFLPNRHYKKNEIPNYIYAAYEIMLWGFLWSKIFKKSILDEFQIRFNENLKFQEDLEFILHYISHVESIYNSELCTYYYNNVDVHLNKYKYYQKFESSSLCLKYILNIMETGPNLMKIKIYFQNMLIEDIICGYKKNTNNYKDIKIKLNSLKKDLYKTLTIKNTIGRLPKLFIISYKAPTFIFHYFWKITVNFILLIEKRI